MYAFSNMDLTGLDVAKIKAMVIEKWRSSPELWPVKVMPLKRVLDLERMRGKKLNAVGGYFTCLRAVRGRSPCEMEDLLGFIPGYLSSGVVVFKFDRAPIADEFELRGYSQLPGGNTFDGIVVRRPGIARPEYLNHEGSRPEYVPGLGVEQWELREGVHIQATEIERLGAGQWFAEWR